MRVLVGISLALWCVGAATPAPRVHVADPHGEVEAALRAELGREAEFVRTATAADVRVRLRDDGRSIIVTDSGRAPLVEREVASAGPAGTRVLVTLAAEAVRRWARDEGRDEGGDEPADQPGAAPPEPTTTATSARAGDEPEPPATGGEPTTEAGGAAATGPSVAAIEEPGPGDGDAPETSSSTNTAAASDGDGLWLSAGADARLWTTPRAPRFGLEVGVMWSVGGWRVGAAVLGGAGPDLRTREIEARLGAVHLLLRGERRGAVAEGLQARAVFGAGVGWMFGRARALEPAFADPGTSDGVTLVDPVLWPGVGLVWRLAPQLEFSVDLSAKIGLRVSSLTLPGTFSAPSEAPLRTDRVQPRLALGLAWGLAGEKE